MSKARITFIAAVIFLMQSDIGYSQEEFPGRQIDSLTKYGIQLYSEGKYKRAITILDSVVKSAQGSLGKYYLGLSYTAVNEIELGLVYMRNAVKEDSLNVGYRFQYARSLSLVGDILNARKQYEMIIRLDTTYIPAYFQLGVLLYDAKMYRDAGQYFEHLQNLNRFDFFANYYLGIIHIALNENKRAFPYLSQCVASNSRFIPGLSALASLFFADSQYQASLQLYLRAVELQPENPEFYNKASLTYSKMKKYDSAYVYSGRAVEIDSSNIIYNAQYGYTALLTEHYDVARDTYEKVIAQDPKEPSYYINLALAYTKLNATESAIKAYRQAIKEYHPESIGMVHYRLSSLLYSDNKYRQAAAECRKAIDLDPNNTEAYFFMALAYDRLKDMKNAIRNYEIYIDKIKRDGLRSDEERLKQAEDRLNYLKTLKSK